jgi:hypothetical protein
MEFEGVGSSKLQVLGRSVRLGLRRRCSDEFLCCPFSQRRWSDRYRPRQFRNRRLEEIPWPKEGLA